MITLSTSVTIVGAEEGDLLDPVHPLAEKPMRKPRSRSLDPLEAVTIGSANSVQVRETRGTQAVYQARRAPRRSLVKLSVRQI